MQTSKSHLISWITENVPFLFQNDEWLTGFGESNQASSIPATETQQVSHL